MKRVLALGLFLFLALSTALAGQAKSPPGFADYGKWESLLPAGGNGGFSPDGRWVAYGINRSNGENELRIARVADGETSVVAFGSQPVFSTDSRWIAYVVGKSEEERETLRDRNEPVENQLGLRNLETDEGSVIDGIDAFAFSPDGAFLVMRRYPAEGPSGEGRGGGDSDNGTPGRTVIVRDLSTGSDMSFGNVADYAWLDTDDSHLLAMVISTADQVGNGIHLFDAEASELRVLDSSESTYENLAWRHDAPDLAVMRSQDEEGMDGPTQVVLLWTAIGGNEQLHTFDPTAVSGFPEGMRTVTYRPFSWSEEGDVLFFGIAGWQEDVEPKSDLEEGGGAGEDPGVEPEEEATAEEEEEEYSFEEDPDDPSTVEIWHWTDAFVMPWQKAHAAQDGRRNLLVAWHVDSGDLVQLGQDLIEERVTPIPHTDYAVVAEWAKYAMERSIGRPGADIYLQDLATGERTHLKENINDRYLQASPGGRYLLYMEDGHFWTIDLTTRAIMNITASAPVSFINMESDQTSKVYPDRLQKPPFGYAGWTTDDASILLYDKYDVWSVASDGSGAVRLTGGAEEEIRHRVVRPDLVRGRPASREDQWIDLDAPIYLSLYGEWTKKSGYGVLEAGGGVERLVWLDKNVSYLAKAEKADVYSYIAQAYDDSPDLFVGGPDLRNARQLTETNPFQDDYAWGHSELIDYVTDRGREMQGALVFPAGYEPGKKYPMIVYNYELLSQNLHRYTVPSDRSYYNNAVFMSHGYLVLQPDIVFRKRQPGWSVVECITAAVEKVIEMGVVDPDRIGIIGHSMGGFNTTFVATTVHDMFAAAVAGAPITDLASYYGDHHWGSGVAETDHIETGQERMEVALYEDLDAYIDNSAVYHAHEMTVPLLLEAGDQDGIVAWYQAIELYNVARRAKKNVVLLGYIGEDHGLRQEANQKDYLRRILAWFGHYLKGEPAEPWMIEGKSFLAREAELKRMEKGR
jgi:dipeptidyl aminopeptidase/acylaminoacyl peptidase